jgi:hypothetical protein
LPETLSACALRFSELAPPEKKRAKRGSIRVRKTTWAPLFGSR